jgi:hypothetical protein
MYSRKNPINMTLSKAKKGRKIPFTRLSLIIKKMCGWQKKYHLHDFFRSLKKSCMGEKTTVT